MTTNIQVYADIVNIVNESNGMNVLLTGIDPNQIVSEFNADEVLECIDLDTVMKYVTKKLREDNE